MFDIIKSCDTTILMFIQEHIKNPMLDSIIPLVTNLGDYGIIWVVIAFILLLTKKYRSTAIILLGALLFEVITIELVLKPLVQRPRPFIEFDTINILINKPSSYSFPSNHTVSSFVAAGILFSSFKKFGILVMVFALLIAFTRLYLFVHNPSDVLAGIIIGLIISKAALIIGKKHLGIIN